MLLVDPQICVFLIFLSPQDRCSYLIRRFEYFGDAFNYLLLFMYKQGHFPILTVEGAVDSPTVMINQVKRTQVEENQTERYAENHPRRSNGQIGD